MPESYSGKHRESAIEKVRRWLALGSLARLTRFHAREARGLRWPAILVVGRWGWLKAKWRSLMYIWLAGIGAILIFLPLPSPSFGPFKTAGSAEQFLRTLWQVEAAALALSLTIIVFAVQAYRTSIGERYGGSLRRFIRASFLQEGYELGVVALLLVGTVLMGVGHNGPSGSAGLMSAVFSLLSIAVLPPLLGRALRTTQRDFLHEERTARLGVAVQAEVDHEVEARFGLLILRRLSEIWSFDLSLYGGKVRTAPERVMADKVGVVSDMKLGRLARLSRRMRDDHHVTVQARLAEYVSPESSVLALPGDMSKRNRRLAKKIARIRPGRRREATLSRYLDDLHEEAISAIRAGGPATFEAISDAYVETLLAFPLSWRRYGQEYSDALAEGIEFFPVGPVDEISKQFYSNVVEALKAGTQEILLTAAYLPMRVSSQAISYRADGLLKKMLRLSPSFLAAAWAHGGDGARLLEERAGRHLVEFVRITLEPRLEEGEIAERVRIAGHVRFAYRQFQEMLKMCVDAGRIDTLRKIDGDWGTLLQHLEMEILDPSPRLIPVLEKAVAEGSADSERLAQARENAKLEELWDDLADYRSMARFGLGLWAWRQQPTAWRESFGHFSSQVGGFSEIASMTAKAIDADNHERMPWSDWILNELQEGEAHAIGSTTAILETFVALALRAVSPSEETPNLTPADWMSQYLDEVRDLLVNAVADSRNSDLPDVAERADKVRATLESGAERWSEQERQNLIEAPLEQKKVEEFRLQAIEALNSARMVPDLLRLGKAVAPLQGRPEDAYRSQFWPHKALFTEDRAMMGADMIAREIGQKLAHWELERLLKPIEQITPQKLVPDDAVDGDAQEFATQLREIVLQLTETWDQGFWVLFLPISWRLSQALGLPFLSTANPPEEWALSEGTAREFVGDFASVPAFQFPEVQDKALYIVDLTRWAIGEEWMVSDEEMVSIQLISEDEARERAARTKGREEAGEAELAARWQERVDVRVDPGLALSEDRDESAVTVVTLPGTLQ